MGRSTLTSVYSNLRSLTVMNSYPSYLHTYTRPDTNLEFFEATKIVSNHIRVFAEWLILIAATAYGAAKLQSAALHLVYLALYFGLVMHLGGTIGAWYRRRYWSEHAGRRHTQSSGRRRIMRVVFVVAIAIVVGLAIEFIENVIDELFQVQGVSLDGGATLQRSKRLGPDWLLPTD